MAFTYDVTTDRGKVRLYIPDTIETGHVFDDADIDAYLEMNDNNVKIAAAEAIETIAASEALVGKVITIQGNSTNGALVCQALMQRAKQLREAAGSAGGVEWCDIASAANDAFTRAELSGGSRYRIGDYIDAELAETEIEE